MKSGCEDLNLAQVGVNEEADGTNRIIISLQKKEYNSRPSQHHFQYLPSVSSPNLNSDDLRNPKCSALLTVRLARFTSLPARQQLNAKRTECFVRTAD